MNQNLEIQIMPPSEEHEGQWLDDLWQSEWGGEIMVSRGQTYRLSDLECLLAKSNGELIGAVTYRLDGAGGCELMSINTVMQGGGIGTQLLTEVEDRARAAGCRRVWLITSNDNLDALRFYQRRGYRIVSVHPGGIDGARRVKPSIPLVGRHGIEIHDEIELARTLEEGP